MVHSSFINLKSSLLCMILIFKGVNDYFKYGVIFEKQKMFAETAVFQVGIFNGSV